MIKRHGIGPRTSQAVEYNGSVYLSGQVAADPKPSVAEQTTQILAQIDKLLAGCGTDKSKLVSASVWLADIAKGYDEMNAVWEKWITPGNPPARATVEAKLAGPQWIVEIAVIAAK